MFFQKISLSKKIKKLVKDFRFISDNVNIGVDCLLFINSNKKVVFYIICNYKKDEVSLFISYMGWVFSNYLKQKIYIKTKLVNGGTKILFSKKPIYKNFNFTDAEIGKLLKFPECCVKKYVEENNFNGLSDNSSLRYLNQLKEIGAKKDIFEINFSPDSGGSKYGFVPCHPKCKKALKLIQEYKFIEKVLSAR